MSNAKHEALIARLAWDLCYDTSEPFDGRGPAHEHWRTLATRLVTRGWSREDPLAAPQQDAVTKAPVCTTCHLRKKPIGRAAAPAMANSLCDHECPGYMEDPKPGYLWPGEQEPTP